jgi:uncharacterized damage-inducible protein DinB
MDNIIEKISDDEWNKEFSGFYKSIHDLCSHIYISDYTWLYRFCESLEFTELKHFFTDTNILNYNWGKTLFKNINEYIKMRKELDDIIIKFINKLSETDLEKTIKLPIAEGKTDEFKINLLIFHMFKHQIHTRGMISLYLEMVGKENEFS